jgi:hypothetical protein
MEIVFLPPAKDEFTEAISYYNGQSEGLGYEFAAEVMRTLERIVQYPDAWFKLSNRTHRCSDAFKQRTENMEVAAQKEIIMNQPYPLNLQI